MAMSAKARDRRSPSLAERRSTRIPAATPPSAPRAPTAATSEAGMRRSRTMNPASSARTIPLRTAPANSTGETTAGGGVDGRRSQCHPGGIVSWGGGTSATGGRRIGPGVARHGRALLASDADQAGERHEVAGDLDEQREGRLDDLEQAGGDPGAEHACGVGGAGKVSVGSGQVVGGDDADDEGRAVGAEDPDERSEQRGRLRDEHWQRQHAEGERCGDRGEHDEAGEVHDHQWPTRPWDRSAWPDAASLPMGAVAIGAPTRTATALGVVRRVTTATSGRTAVVTAAPRLVALRPTSQSPKTPPPPNTAPLGPGRLGPLVVTGPALATIRREWVRPAGVVCCQDGSRGRSRPRHRRAPIRPRLSSARSAARPRGGLSPVRRPQAR